MFIYLLGERLTMFIAIYTMNPIDPNGKLKSRVWDATLTTRILFMVT